MCDLDFGDWRQKMKERGDVSHETRFPRLIIVLLLLLWLLVSIGRRSSLGWRVTSMMNGLRGEKREEDFYFLFFSTDWCVTLLRGLLLKRAIFFFLSDAFTLDGAEKIEIYKIPLHGNPPREFLTFSRLTVYCVVIDFSGLPLLHWDARLFRSFS